MTAGEVTLWLAVLVTGISCEVVGPCASSPCSPTSNCAQDGHNYTCHCADGKFLANVNVLRYVCYGDRNSVCLSSVCLSVVCNVGAPYSGG